MAAIHWQGGVVVQITNSPLDSSQVTPLFENKIFKFQISKGSLCTITNPRKQNETGQSGSPW